MVQYQAGYSQQCSGNLQLFPQLNTALVLDSSIFCKLTAFSIIDYAEVKLWEKQEGGGT